MSYPKYSYEGLDLDHGEIRLLTVLPGGMDDPLRISLHHAILSIPGDDFYAAKSPDLDTIQRNLPPGWTANATLDGRALFWKPDDPDRTKWRSQWHHPDQAYGGGNLPVPGLPRRLSEDQPVFDALSYVWGPEQPVEQLIVVPHEDTPTTRAIPGLSAVNPLPVSAMSVRQNVAVALRHLRYPDRARVMWVDVVCIDQANLTERGRHVARMGSIYALATRVVAWLGPATADSELAMTALERLGSQLEMVGGVNLPAPGATDPDWLDRYPCDEVTLLALRNLLNDSIWFQRLWIWQEIVLANCSAAVQCGEKMVPWYTLRRGLVALRETSLPDAWMRKGLMPNPLTWLPYIFERAARDRLSISTLLLATAQSACTDPKDRIYALLSMCNRELSKTIIPDYTLTHGQVFEDFTLKFVKVYRNLVLMQYCDFATRQLQAPTWVPDWTRTVVRPWQLAQASGVSQAEAEVVSPGVLGAAGVRSGEVTAVSAAHWNGLKYPTSLTEAIHIIKKWHKTWLESTKGNAPLEDFISAVRYGWTWERRRVGQSAKAYGEDFMRLVDGNPDEDELGRSEFLESVIRDERTCTFFCTSLGHAGMGPTGTLPGDIVAVLLGCPYPIVLRPADHTAGTKGKFCVVGHPYVHGRMDGEALLGPIPAPWAIQNQRRHGKR